MGISNGMKKLKNFIHKHETLEKLVLFVWGSWRILRAKFIFRKIKYTPIKKEGPKVLILAVRTSPANNLVYFDAIFWHAFKKLGCDVKMLYCDGVLDSCDADTIFRKSMKPRCFACKNLGPLVKKSLGLDCISYRQYISDSEIEEIKKEVSSLEAKDLIKYKYLGVNVGVHASASTIRYFLLGHLNLDNPSEVAMFRKKLVHSMIAAKVAKKIADKEKPNVIFMLHGIYSTWGPFSDYFQLRGIETVVYSNMPPRFGHFIFNRNDKANALVSKKEWSNFSRSSLKDAEKSEIDAYLAERFKGETGDQKLYEENFDIGTKKQSLLESLSRKEYFRQYVMYPNLAWDSAIDGRVSKIFDDIFSWVDETVKFFKEHKNYQLIIKPHPAELVWEKPPKGIRDYIIEEYGPLPENLILLEPNVPLRAYDLVAPDRIVLVFNGSLGLELAASGIPVLTVADVHYKDAGVVYKVETLEEYLKLLEDPKELISFAKDNIELAKKYAYFYFFKSMVRIPFYRDDEWSAIDWNIARNIKKLLDDNSNIIKICKKIINKEDIVGPL